MIGLLQIPLLSTLKNYWDYLNSNFVSVCSRNQSPSEYKIKTILLKCCVSKNMSCISVNSRYNSGIMKLMLLYSFFWVVPRRLNMICRRFGTLRLFHLHTYPPMKIDLADCSETSAYKIQTPVNYPEESKQHLEHGESFKSRRT